MSAADSPSGDDRPAHAHGDAFDHGQTLVSRRNLIRSTAAAGAIGAAGLGSSGTAAAVDNYCLGTDNENCALDGAIEFVTGAVDGLFSSGYDKSQTQDMVANNQHWEVYESLQNADSILHGFHVETDNWTVPSDPTRSALADLAWGEARAYAFRQIEEQGDSVNEQDVVDGAIAKAEEYLSTIAKNYIRQWNEFVWIQYRHSLTFYDENRSVVDDNYDYQGDTNHAEGQIATDEEGTGFAAQIQHNPTPEGLDPANVFTFVDSTGTDMELGGFGVQIREYTLPNGELEPEYGADWQYGTSLSSETLSPSNWTTSNESGWHVDVESPDGDRLTYFTAVESESPWLRKIGAVEDVHTQIAGGELETYISEILVDVRQDDLEPIEILSPADYAREFGDAQGLTRLDAEMAALGMQGPSDPSTGRTLSWTDDDGNERTATGTPYVSWDWTTLEPWEWSYDATNHVLTVDTDSISQDGVLDLTYDDSSSTVVGVDMNNLDEDGKIDVSADAPADASVASIALDLAGELNSFWPEGKTITVGSGGTAEVLIFGYENADGNFTRETITGDVTLEDAGDGDRLQLEGYNTRTRDPARALDTARYYDNQRQDTTDLEESDPLVIGEGLGNSLLAGLAVIAVIVVAVARVVSGR